MRFIKYILFPLFFIQNISAFTRNPIRKHTVLRTFESVEFESQINNELTLLSTIQKKSNALVTMIRPTNLLPTILIGISSGIIMNPVFIELLKTKAFLASNCIVLLIMSNSMIINDVFDIHIDKANNQSRPLVNCDITVKESALISLLLLAGTQFVNYKFIPKSLQYIPTIANYIIYAYTPILKRIPFIKNLSCSLLISLSLIFTGLCANPSNFIGVNKNFPLLALASQMLFVGSFYNELLLDISDISGDRKNKVYTLPVLLGERETLKIVGNITVLNLLWCAMNLTHMFGISQGMLLIFFCFPFLKNLILINDSDFSKQSIKYAVNETIKPMVACLILFCFLRR